MTDEQIVIYDLLTSVELTLSADDRAAVKQIGRELPWKIQKKLVIDWRKSQMKRAAVRVAIKTALKDLPEPYADEVAFQAALDAIYEHVYESYWGEGRSKYATVETPDPIAPFR